MTVPLTAMALAVLASVGGAAVPSASVAAPPPDRAYELVTPEADAASAVVGVSTDFYPMPGRSSEDGDRFLYGAGATFGEGWSGNAHPMIFGRRTPTGWQGRSAIRSVDGGDTPMELQQHEVQAGWLSPAGDELVFGSPYNLGSDPSRRTLPGVYRSQDALTPPQWLSQPVFGTAAVGTIRLTGLSSTEDLRTTIFQSTAPLTEDAPAANTSAVYVYRDGELTLASRLPDGSVPAANATLANADNPPAFLNNGARAPAVAYRNHLAGDGRYVLFTVGRTGSIPTTGFPLYVRDLEEGVTRQLAGGGTGATENVDELGLRWGAVGQSVAVDAKTVPQQATLFAAESGARAFFKPTRVVATTPSFMYEADLETGAVIARPAITGVPLGVTAEGDGMLFLEPPPPPTGTSAVPGNWLLKYWNADSPDTAVTVGTVPATAAAYGLTTGHGLARVYRSSEDGQTWFFTAVGAVDPAHPSVSATSQQLYRWSVGDATPTCLTCEPIDGVSRTSGVSLTVQEALSTERFQAPTTSTSVSGNIFNRMIAQRGRSLSDDGRWLLFDSPDRLVAEDANDVRDVYLWDRDAPSGDRLQLLTSGRGNSPAYALDIDKTGKNAFFTTRDGLVRADDNGSYDVYTARIGGGFPEAPDESCVGAGCREAAIPGPPLPGIGSVGLGGDGNVPLTDSVNPSVGVSKLKAVIGLAARLKVRVPGAGRISVAGSSVRRSNRSAARAGTYSVRVSLSSKARKSLKRKKTLKVNVRVAFRAKDGELASKTVAVTFKQPKPKRARGTKGGR